VFVDVLMVGGVSAATLALGLAFLLRPDRMVACQERYVARFATVGPEDNPDYYDDTRETRLNTFRLGGFVMTMVGLLFLGVTAFGVLYH
jgi:hypothetical protein